ncbi:MAG: hypothetical protein AABY45_06190 [Deltaproteobacteria bacterium]
MECPYFEAGTEREVCSASITLMTPDAHDETRYCATEDHYRCPMLLAYVLRGDGSVSLC